MRTFSARETAWLQELDGIELASFRRRAFAFLIDWSIVGVVLTLLFTFGALAYVGLFHRDRLKVDWSRGNMETRIDKMGDSLEQDAAEAPSPCESATAGSASAPATSPSHVQIRRQLHGESLASEFWHEASKIFADIVVPCLYFGLFLWRWNGQTPGKRWMKIRVVSLVHPHMTFWHSIERALGYGAAALELGFGFFQFWIHPYRRCAQDRLAETIVVTEPSYQHMFQSLHQELPAEEAASEEVA